MTDTVVKCEKCGAGLVVASDDKKFVEREIEKFNRKHAKCKEAK